MNDKLTYAHWLRVHRVLGGTVKFTAVYKQYQDPAVICDLLDDAASYSGMLKGISPEKANAFSLDGALDTVARCEELGCDIIPFDSVFYPPLLRDIKDAPAVLFSIGDKELLRNGKTVGIVGSRKASEQGERAAFILGCGLSRVGITVVSGGAEGIDMYAGAGGAAEQGGTVSVMGSGFFSDTPFRKLYTNENAVFVTEMFPDTVGRRFTFPKRNRIISGMSNGVVVVEAAEKSGAIITARHCAAQKRHILVPLPELLSSRGCEDLILSGAQTVCSAGDCIELLFGDTIDQKTIFPDIRLNCDTFGGLYDHIVMHSGNKSRQETPVRKTKTVAAPVKPKKTAKKAELLPSGLSNNALKLYAMLTEVPVHADELSYMSGIKVSELLAAVIELELEDLAHMHPGNRISY